MDPQAPNQNSNSNPQTFSGAVPPASQPTYAPQTTPQQNISVNVPPVSPFGVSQTPAPMHQSIGSDRPRGTAGETFAHKGTEVVIFVFGSLEVMLTIRFVFKLFAAQSANMFVSLIYQFTELFVEPFTGIFRSVPSALGHVLEIETVIAGIVYALIAFGLIKIVQLFK
jgi:hypothetical protein